VFCLNCNVRSADCKVAEVVRIGAINVAGAVITSVLSNR